jgi:hypothetical protein
VKKTLTRAEQDLVDRFEAFSPAEKAAALRGMARDEPDRATQVKLIMAALRMDAVALMEDEGPSWKDAGYATSTGPFIDDAKFLTRPPKKS